MVLSIRDGIKTQTRRIVKNEERLRRVRATGWEIANFGLYLAQAVDAADAFHCDDGLQTGPVAQRLEQNGLRTGEDSAADQTSMFGV
jgi:hypothetical protein